MMSEKQTQHLRAIASQGGTTRWQRQRQRDAAGEAMKKALSRILTCWERETNMAAAMEEGQAALDQAREVF